MSDLTDYYQEKIPAMSTRKITPYFDGPNKTFLEELACIVNQDENPHVENVSKKSRRKRRSRTKSVSDETDKSGNDSFQGNRQTSERQISISSDTSIISEEDLMEIDNMLATSPVEHVCFEDTPRKVPNLQKSSPVSIPLKAPVNQTQNAQKSWNSSESTHSQMSHWEQSPNQITSPKSPGISLRDIIAEERVQQDRQITNQDKHGKSNKFSWKEAKKQQKQNIMARNKEDGQDNKREGQGKNNHQSENNSVNKPLCPWGQMNQVVKSFRDLVVEEQSHQQTSVGSLSSKLQRNKKISKTEPVSKSAAAQSTKPLFSWGVSTPVAPKTKTLKQQPDDKSDSPEVKSEENPWQKKLNRSDSAVKFSEIIQDEREKHEQFTRTSKKPLNLIQIEEQAIQELLQFYKADENFNEHITVERVPQAMAAPLWAAKQRQQQQQPYH